MLADVLALIDNSQFYDKETLKQVEVIDELNISEYYFRSILKELLDGNYIKETDEYKRLRAHAKIKYIITKKGRKLLEE